MSKQHHIMARWHKTEIIPDVRNTGLDVFRGICVMVVVLAHSNNILGHYLKIYKYISPFGYLIQEGFFALSGFLIMNQLLKLLSGENKIRSLLLFYQKRWIRTLPFYFFFIVVNYLLYKYTYSVSKIDYLKSDFEVSYYFTCTQNFFTRHPAFFPEIWPIPIEEWSYLMIPIPFLVLFVVLKKPEYRHILWLIFLMIIIASVIRIKYVLEVNPSQDWELRKIVFYRLDALLYGCIISVIVKWKESFFKKWKTVLLLIAFSLSTIISFLAFKFQCKEMNVVLFNLIPVLMAFTLPYFRYHNFGTGVCTRIMTHISLIGYSVLLIHLYFLQFSLITLVNPQSISEALGLFIAYIILLFVMATLFYNYVERPILLLRKQN